MLRSAALRLLLAVAAAGFCTAQFDCDKGCPATSAAVCGEDGITYQNRCLAFCQGVQVASMGPCASKHGLMSGDVAFASASPAAGAPQVISAAAMRRYSADGFRLAGRAASERFTPFASYRKRPASSGGGGGGGGPGDRAARLMSIDSVLPDRAPPVAAVRQTADGHVYYSTQAAAQSHFAAVKATFMAASSSGEESTGHSPARAERAATEMLLREMMGRRRRLHGAGSAAAAADSRRRGRRRHLLHRLGERPGSGAAGGAISAAGATGRALRYIIGDDERVETPPTAGWPFSAVGQFLYANGSCTGVMVGPRAVLTAGHCVYSRKRRAWQRDIEFLPWRHRDGDDVVEPFGRVPYESVTTYSGWVDNLNTTDAMKYDIAVVRLANDTVGLATGWLGLTWDKMGYAGDIYTIGYPGDKVRGSQWWSVCPVRDGDGDDTRFVNTCDVWPGQSGSPMWEWRTEEQYYMRAVLSYESCKCCNADCSCCDSQVNGGCAINALHYRSILGWR